MSEADKSEIMGFLLDLKKTLIEVKDHPQAIGLTLIGAGMFLRTVWPQLDWVIWDFSGNHAPIPPPVKKTAPTNPDPSNPNNLPWWAKDVVSYASTFFGLAELTGPGAAAEGILSGLQSASGLPVDPNAALGSLGAPVPNILGLLGIKLPTQITISEVMIFSGLLSLSEPLLKAVTGSLGSIFSSALKIA